MVIDLNSFMSKSTYLISDFILPVIGLFNRLFSTKYLLSANPKSAQRLLPGVWLFTLLAKAFLFGYFFRTINQVLVTIVFYIDRIQRLFIIELDRFVPVCVSLVSLVVLAKIGLVLNLNYLMNGYYRFFFITFESPPDWSSALSQFSIKTIAHLKKF